jgi:type II secretory pathway predicted ATPase ExeA
MSPLIGRSGELAAIGACLDANRLVTLTGAGGVGKTRLAVEAAAERTNREAIRCWWVDLATLRNPDAVASAVASALAVRETVNEAAVDAIGRFVGGRPVLLVLDNCEHLVAPRLTQQRKTGSPITGRPAHSKRNSGSHPAQYARGAHPTLSRSLRKYKGLL